MLMNTLTQLRNITSGCRDDMHEPDEQGLKARVVGDHLDNAMGTHVSPEMIAQGAQEYVVFIERLLETGRGRHTIIRQRFNLADLIALARKAVL